MSKFLLYGAILQTFFFTMLIAKEGKAQKESVHEIRVSVAWHHITLSRALMDLEQKTPFKFTYHHNKVDDKAILNFNAANTSLGKVLLFMSENANLKFQRINNNIHISRKSKKDKVLTEKFQEQIIWERQISGKVTDENGVGLPGVNVIVKGYDVGTISDVNGNYKLSVPDNATTLVFSYVGYIAEEVTIGGRSVIDFSLTPDISTLSEVVVIGYGTAKRSDLSGAVSSVAGSDIEKITATSFDRALQGRSAGVLVSQNNGAPGATPNIRIRGSGSVNSSNEPLYVIDGLLVFPSNAAINGGGSFRVDQLTGNPTNLLATINPNDIESIEVLKDASATAIYGSRGANGVIVITTKRGKAGKGSFNVDWYTSVRTIADDYPLLNAGEYAQFTNEYNDLIGSPRPYTDSEVQNFKNNDGTNWQDETFRNAIINNLQLSANGGNEKAQYYLSANYLDEDGIIINNNLKRISLRANLDILPTDRIKIGNSFTASYSINNGVPFGGRDPSSGPGVINGVLDMPPVDPVFNDDGTYKVIPSRSTGATTNPVALAQTQELIYRTLRTLGTFYVEYEFMEGLTGKINLGFDLSAREESSYFPQETTLLGMEQSGQARRINTTDINWLTEYLLNYNKVFGDHSLNVVGGFTMQANRLSRLFAGRENFLTDAFGTTNLSGGSVEIIPQTSLVESSLVSLLGRINYIFKDKYIFTFSSRYDGSSRFGENNKYAFFPSGAIAWKLGEEDFISGSDFFDDLKLRVSYGITGNQEIGSYRSLARFVTVGENFGGTAAVGVAPSATGLPNPDLTWEQTSQLDIGIDATILQGKLNLTLDYYQRKTTDLLFAFPLPIESGFANILQNSGGVKNTGFELTAGTNISAGALNMNFNGNFSYNKNEISDLGGVDSVITGSQVRIIGQPLGSYYSYDVLGVWQQNEAAAAAEFGRVPGDFKYRDANSDGVYTTADRVVLGQSQPKFFYGFSTDFAYKGFELSLFFQGAGGHKIENRMRYERIIRFQGVANTFKEALDHWSPGNPSNSVSAPDSTDPFRNGNGITLGEYIEKGDYFRLKNVTLAYNLSGDFLKTLKLSKVRVYVSGQNLLTFTGYKGLDPEIIGSDNFIYPFTNSYRAGINIGF